MRIYVSLLSLISFLLLLSLNQVVESAETTVHGRLFSQWELDLSKRSDNQNEFSLGRAYITIKSKLSDRSGLRLTTDLVETEYEEGKSRYELIFKYAYFDLKPKFAHDALTIRLGLQPTLYTAVQNKLWSRRYLSKIVGDLQKYLTSSDIGLSFQYVLGEEGRYGSIAAAILNGASYKAIGDLNKQKDFGFFAQINPLTNSADFEKSTLVAQYYTGTQNRDFSDSLNSANFSRQLISLGGLLAYRELFNVGVDFNKYSFGQGAEEIEKNQQALSLFGTIYLSSFAETHKLLETLNLFGRVDLVDPDIDSRMKNDQETHLIFGIECAPVSGFKMSINFRSTTYDNSDQTKAMIYLNSLFKF